MHFGTVLLALAGKTFIQNHRGMFHYTLTTFVCVLPGICWQIHNFKKLLFYLAKKTNYFPDITQTVWGGKYNKKSSLFHKELQIHIQQWLHHTNRLPNVFGDSQEQSPPVYNELLESSESRSKGHFSFKVWDSPSLKEQAAGREIVYESKKTLMCYKSS